MNGCSITVPPDEIDAVLECLWLLLWQAAQPLPHPAIRPALVARLYEQALMLAESIATAEGQSGENGKLWALAQHHRHRLARWREELGEIYEEYGEV